MLNNSFQCELAKTYSPNVKIGACMLQPKLDGCRAWAALVNGEVQLFTRNGNLIKGCNHIKQELSHILTTSDIVLDGELYSHGLTFQQIIKQVKSDGEQLQFWAFDLIDGTQSGYFTRYNALKSFVGECKHVLCVNTLGDAKSDLYAIPDALESALKDGYEGLIIRTDTPHVNGRSNGIFKLKQQQDAEFVVKDICKALKGGFVAVLCNEEGKVFKAALCGNVSEQRAIYYKRNRWINKQATVKFNGYTDGGLPRFAKMVAIRNYE